MYGLLPWLIGGLTAFLGIIGVYLAGHEPGSQFDLPGLAVFVLAVVFIGFLVRWAWDKADEEKSERK